MLIIYNFFFFNDTATTEIYTLSLHDALPIFRRTCRTKRRYESWSVPKLTMRRYLLRLTAASDCCERIEGTSVRQRSSFAWRRTGTHSSRTSITTWAWQTFGQNPTERLCRLWKEK